VAILKDFWPASTQGAILVTSQNPKLAVLCDRSIHLQPLSKDEGSALIQNFLQRGGSEKEDAQRLSENLGGLPLAITHFAGAVMRSNCPIAQISQSFLQREHTSKFWALNDETSEARGYDHTLNTVWDFAIARLPPESTKVLRFIAFLDPDQVQVSLMTDQGQEDGNGNEIASLVEWDVFG
jgi:hypothetical protein